MAKILVIDDDEGWRTVMSELLRLERHEVIEAGDGGKGVLLCREHRPDLVITDIIMPEQEGLETIELLRMEFPTLPVIAVSGGGEFLHKDQNLLLAEKLGACAAIPKPLNREALLEAVDRALRTA